MIRNTNQLFLSKETDSWDRHFMGYVGTALGNGTLVMTVPVSGKEQIFVTDISFISSLNNASLHLMHGTSMEYHVHFYAGAFGGGSGGNWNQSFNTPIKIPKGTNLDIQLSGLFGTHMMNVQGYIVK